MHGSGQLLPAGLGAFGEWRGPLGCLSPLARDVDNGNNIRTWFDGSHWSDDDCHRCQQTFRALRLRRQRSRMWRHRRSPYGQTMRALVFWPRPRAGLGQNDGFRRGQRTRRLGLPAAPTGTGAAPRGAAAPAAAASRDRRLIPPPDAPAPGCPSAYPSATTCPRTRQSGGAASARPPWQSGLCCRARSRASCCRSA